MYCRQRNGHFMRILRITRGTVLTIASYPVHVPSLSVCSTVLSYKCLVYAYMYEFTCMHIHARIKSTYSYLFVILLYMYVGSLIALTVGL